MSLRPLLAAVLLMTSALSSAQDYKVGNVQVAHPFARPTVPNQPSGGAYVTLENIGNTPDKLISATSPIANAVQLHTMSMDGNIMRMREVSDIALPAGAKVAMKPGDGFHLMLQGLKQPLKNGDKFPLSLVFEKAGKVDISVAVENNMANMEMEGHHHH